MAKRLVLFVHGLTGSPELTWDRFPQFLRDDAELGPDHDVDFFAYDAPLLGASPDPALVAEALKSEIDNRHSAYDEIIIVAHSLGGLVARRYIADQLAGDRKTRVTKLLLYATPNTGAVLANAAKSLVGFLKATANAVFTGAGWLIPGASKPVLALALDSDFLIKLNTDWGRCKADERLAVRYVVAAADDCVGVTSAWGPS